MADDLSEGEHLSGIEGGLGRSLPHDSAALHVTGRAGYTDDIREPKGTLQAYVLSSPHAHARIERIDTSRCFLPGVLAVVTSQDIPGHNDVAPVFDGDPVFAEGEVHYVGQSVLAVAAETIEIARAAAKLAEVVYTELPAILDVHTAIRQQTFVGKTYVMKRGDAGAAIARAPHKLKGTLEIGGQDHFYLEGQIALVTPSDAGEIHCWTSTQHPSEVQHLIAKVLGISENAVTTEVRRMGGGFGGKESQASLIACIAAVLAQKTGRPVKLRLDRDDDMKMTGKRHDFSIAYEVGFDGDGRLLGMDVTHAVNGGMSADLTNAIADRAMFHADNAYFVPDVRVTSYRCRTNKVSNTAFRGFGGPQGMLATEHILDSIARTLGKDPLAVRTINLYDAKGALGERCTTHYGMTVEDSITGEILDAVHRRSDYARRRAEIDAFNAQSPILKKGLALTPVKFGISFTLTLLNQAGALVHVYKDGTVQVNHGGTEMGQGLHTKICQVVAEELQIDLSRVRITATSTGKVPNTSATAASSGSDLNGKAAQIAARTIKERLIAFLAQHFSVPESDVTFRRNEVHIGSAKVLRFPELIQLAYVNRVSLSSTGFYKTPKIHWDKEKANGRPFYYFAYGAAATEVIVDTLTGEHRFLRADIVHDVGRSMNPAIDIGQIEGAYVQGTGWLTSEELWWDGKGALRTHAPSTYKIPTGRDVPAIMNVTLHRGDNPEDTIYRSKAVGEPPLMLGISSFLAIRDAIAAVGGPGCVPPLDAPATPEQVLRSITAVRGE